MYTVMEALWWAGCTYGSFKVLQWCNCFPPASIFDVQHVAGNSLDASGSLIFSSHSCQKAWWHNVSSTKNLIYTHVGPFMSMFLSACVLKCLPLSLSVLPLSIATCRAQQHYPAFKYTQIPTDQNTALHQIQWKACLLMIRCEDNRRLDWEMEKGRGRRKREVRGESGWGSEAVGEWSTAGAFIISHCKGARWDNWSPKLNAQHAFLMSPHCCSFNI